MNVEDFQRWNSLKEKERKEIMDRFKNSGSHLGCQNCDSLKDTLRELLFDIEYFSGDDPFMHGDVEIFKSFIRKQVFDKARELMKEGK